MMHLLNIFHKKNEQKAKKKKIYKIKKHLVYNCYLIQKYKAEFTNIDDGYKEEYLCLIDRE